MDTVTRIFELVDNQFKEQKEFAAAIGVSDKIVSQWRVGTTRSYRTRIATIADVLGTTTEYLLTGKKEPAPTDGDGLSPAKRQLLEAVDDLTDEQCEKLLGIVREAKRLL